MDEATNNDLRAFEAQPMPASVREIVIDDKNKIVSTPAYMLGKRISDVAAGIEKLVECVLGMC